MVFYGYHGAFIEEQKLGQRFEVDLEFELDASKAFQSDMLSDTISYVGVYDTVLQLMTNTPFRLLETLANRILETLLNQYPLLSARIKIRKPSVPLPGILDHVEVEVVWNHNHRPLC